LVGFGWRSAHYPPESISIGYVMIKLNRLEIRAMEVGILKLGETFNEKINPSTLAKDNDKLLVKGALSKELQLYFEKVVEAGFSEDSDISKVAIESIGRDPGLQPLLPYFVQLATETVTY
jgi:hypothetical protein